MHHMYVIEPVQINFGEGDRVKCLCGKISSFEELEAKEGYVFANPSGNSWKSVYCHCPDPKCDLFLVYDPGDGEKRLMAGSKMPAK